MTAYGVLGVGAIAAAIVRGLCDGDDAPDVLLSPRNAETGAGLAERIPTVEVAPDNQAVVDGAEVVIVCLRTEHARPVLAELRFPADRVVISAMASVPLDELRRLVAPATEIVRSIPFPAVARREGATLVHPPHPAAAALFDRLGETVEVADAEAFDALTASTATIAAHFAYLRTIAEWLESQGVAGPVAHRYIASIYGGLAALTRGGEGFEDLANEHATPGGLNERFLIGLERDGVFENVRAGLERIHDSR
jgi:pyrroline-5-carboxylate reductase